MIGYQVGLVCCSLQVMSGIIMNNLMFVIKDPGVNYGEVARCFDDFGLTFYGGRLCVPAQNTGGGPGSKSDDDGSLRTWLRQYWQIPQRCTGSYIAEAQAA